MNIAPLCPSWPARFALLVVFALTCRSFAFEDWRAISPDELKMTSDPQAPGAPAIILWRQVDRDDRGLTAHEVNYVRIKILTEEGRKYAYRILRLGDWISRTSIVEIPNHQTRGWPGLRGIP